MGVRLHLVFPSFFINHGAASGEPAGDGGPHVFGRFGAVGKILPKGGGLRDLHLGQVFLMPIIGLPFSVGRLVMEHQEKRVFIVSFFQPLKGVVGDEIGVVAFDARPEFLVA